MKRALFLILASMLPSFATAQTLWAELTQGDLSDDRFNPTPLVVVPGDNFLFGVIEGGDGEGNLDRDYFRMTIPSGFQLSQLVLENYASVDFGSFIGIQPGPIFPDDPDTVRPGDLLGWTIFGPPQVNLDLLPLIGLNGRTFTPPLPAGTYSFWVQQTDDFTEWTGNFVVTEVPEPMSGACLALFALVLCPRRSR